MTVTVRVTGVRELDKALAEMKRGAVNRVMRPALNKAAKYSAARVKETIPGRYKTIRAAIGYRALKSRHNSGFVGAKVGAAVGKKRKRMSQKDRANRKGVGIDRANIHWWFLGTDERFTGQKRKRFGGKKGRGGWRGKLGFSLTGGGRRRTGRMPPQSDPIDIILRRSAGQIAKIIRTWTGVGIKKEADRAAAKAK